MSNHKPTKLFGRAVRLEDETCYIYFPHVSKEAAFNTKEITELFRRFPEGRLRVDHNGKGRLYVRLRWRKPGERKPQQESVARLLQSRTNADAPEAAPHAGQQVRCKNGNSLDLTPGNRKTSLKGKTRGTDSAFQEIAKRQWKENNTAHVPTAPKRCASQSTVPHAAPCDTPPPAFKRQEGGCHE